MPLTILPGTLLHTPVSNLLICVVPSHLFLLYIHPLFALLCLTL